MHVACVQVGRYTPTHAILGTLGDSQNVPAVTTSYDPLYEDAIRSAGGRCLRIPWDLDEARGDAGSSMPQLIKMHGCVTEPDSIVITREDYMR